MELLMSNRQRYQYVIAFTLALMLMMKMTSSYTRNTQSTDLRILWTNDTHGYLSPLYHREEGDNLFVERAKREGRVGGFAYIATVVNRQRDELPDRTLLLDSGDTWHGTVVPVRLAGTPVVEVMNAMGYDAMVPGNVEMFYDQETIEKLLASAKFPIVVANLYDTEWDERASLPNTQPYIIKQVNGLKVGIIGMTYHWMSKVSDQPQWSFGLRVDEVQADVDQMRKQEDVDLVVMLSHMGWKVDEKYAELVSGIDVIVGAHTHDTLYRPTLVYNQNSKRDVIIVQCGSHGKLLGQLDLKVAGGQVEAFEQTLFPIRSREITADPEIASLIEKFREPYKKELERVIGKTRTVLYRQGTWQSPADNLVSDALRARTEHDIAITQPGRYGATVLPGPITVEDVYNLVPIESPIYQMNLSGSDLRLMFEAAIDNILDDDALERVGGNMWRYSGVNLAVDLSRPYPERIQKMHIGGEAVKDDKLYSLAEFNMFFRNSQSAVNVEKTKNIGPHEVIAYIEEQKEVAPVLDSRLTDQHGHIMGDHTHLNEVWKETGRNEINIDRSRFYKYRGVLDKKGRFSVVSNWHDEKI
jgi:S-sulfosulfanyl-L-cysteine sulfohydrolase